MHNILGLPEELLVEILRVCDVPAVLRLEQTCSTFRSLSALRRVWLDQLRALEWYHAPNLPPNVSVHALSAHELRAVVTKAVRAQKAWDASPSPSPSHAHSPSGPTHTREDRVLLPMGRHFRRRMPLVTLCPGGAHLLVFWLDGVLELFAVQTNALVWAYPPEPLRASVKVEEFGFEMAPTGDLMVLVCMRSATLYLSASSTLFEIIRINPEKRTEQSVFQKVFHEDLEQFDFVESARISGNIAAVCMTNKICLIDWEKDDCVELHSAYLVDSMEIAQQTLVCSQHAEDDYSIVVISFPHVFAAALPSLSDIQLQLHSHSQSARPTGRRPKSVAPAHHPPAPAPGHGTGAVSAVWRRLDYADAIAQFVLLKIPENNGVITQRMAVCTPTWRLAHASPSPSSAALETTIYYIQYVEFVDGNKHNSLLHRFTLYGAGGGTGAHRATVTRADSGPRLHLEAQLFGCIRLPKGLRPTTAAGLSRAGRTVIAATAAPLSLTSVLGAGPGDAAHFKFSVKGAEERERQLESQSQSQLQSQRTPGPPQPDAAHCTPIELEGVEKGYTFEVEPYSGAVLYTLAREEMVVIRYYD